MSQSQSSVSPGLPFRRRGSVTDKNMKCAKCNVMVVPKKDKSLTCKLCDSIWHRSCIDGMDDETYQVLKKNEKKESLNIRWYCTKQCDKAAEKFLSGMAHLEAEMVKTNQKVSEIENSVATIRDGVFTEKMVETVKEITQDSTISRIKVGDFTEEMTETVKNIAQEIVDQTEVVGRGVGDAAAHVANVQEIIETEKKEQLAEIEDRMRRKTNLVIFRLPETEHKSIKEAKVEDEQKMKKILIELKTEHTTVDIRRLGQFKKGSEKPRPLRISFDSEKARDEVLSSAYKVSKNKKEEDNRLCTQVSMRKDLTVQEREEEDQLYAELKRRRQDSKESGDDKAKWVRRRGRVVNIGNYKVEEEERTNQDDRGPQVEDEEKN